jgi:hypothetical protein
MYITCRLAVKCVIRSNGGLEGVKIQALELGVAWAFEDRSWHRLGMPHHSNAMLINSGITP